MSRAILMREILWILQEEGPMTAKQIAERLSTTPSTIMGPLKSLSYDGSIVKSVRDSKKGSVWAFQSMNGH